MDKNKDKNEDKMEEEKKPSQISNPFGVILKKKPKLNQ